MLDSVSYIIIETRLACISVIPGWLGYSYPQALLWQPDYTCCIAKNVKTTAWMFCAILLEAKVCVNKLHSELPSIQMHNLFSGHTFRMASPTNMMFKYKLEKGSYTDMLLCVHLVWRSLLFYLRTPSSELAPWLFRHYLVFQVLGLKDLQVNIHLVKSDKRFPVSETLRQLE